MQITLVKDDHIKKFEEITRKNTERLLKAMEPSGDMYRRLRFEAVSDVDVRESFAQGICPELTLIVALEGGLVKYRIGVDEAMKLVRAVNGAIERYEVLRGKSENGEVDAR